MSRAWSAADQRYHRAVLWAAIGGRGPVPAPPFPDPSPRAAAERDQRPSVCPACLAGAHGPGCDGVPCGCRCRATLGLDGPFPGRDPTAPGVDEMTGRVA